jgi:hypothetical protein
MAYPKPNRDSSAMAAGGHGTTMFQFPSNWAAIAGGAKLTIAKAVKRAKARIRLPITVSSFVGQSFIKEAPARWIV